MNISRILLLLVVGSLIVNILHALLSYVLNEQFLASTLFYDVIHAELKIDFLETG